LDPAGTGRKPEAAFYADAIMQTSRGSANGERISDFASEQINRSTTRTLARRRTADRQGRKPVR